MATRGGRQCDRALRAVVGSLSFALIFFSATHAFAWDSATHRLITRLAIGALPQSPLKTEFLANEARLERHSVEPDSVLKNEYGRSEEIRHFIDLENFGSDPFSVLTPDFATMQRQFGTSAIIRAGTLPWTIDSIADKLPQEWKRNDCTNVLRDAGYLAHYVGDASQPLHTTASFDGYNRRDRGLHARIELAVDHHVQPLGQFARPEVRVTDIAAVWPAELAEIRQAHQYVARLIDDDRLLRGLARSGDRDGYEKALISREQSLFISQIASAASTLASIWLFEWRSAGSPSGCSGRVAAQGGSASITTAASYWIATVSDS
ncbi:MAG TPA: hypothetical protein VIX59_07595 [Candidatus Binataceae bacterium]